MIVNILAIKAAVMLSALITQVVVHIHDTPIPGRLRFEGPAIFPEAELIACPLADRKMLQPELDDISALLRRAGAMRRRTPSFVAGRPLHTPDGLTLSLLPARNDSYVIRVDSTHSRGVPEAYLAPCVKMVSGTAHELDAVGLIPPKMNLATAQYSPVVGFYIELSSR